jgi:hypothetical protein
MSAVVKDYFQAGVKRPGSRAKRSNCSFLHELDHWSRVCPAGSALEVEAAKDELSAHREANDFSVPKTDDKPVGLGHISLSVVRDVVDDHLKLLPFSERTNLISNIFD